jgi:hypothetical protein
MARIVERHTLSNFTQAWQEVLQAC